MRVLSAFCHILAAVATALPCTSVNTAEGFQVWVGCARWQPTQLGTARSDLPEFNGKISLFINFMRRLSVHDYSRLFMCAYARVGGFVWYVCVCVPCGEMKKSESVDGGIVPVPVKMYGVCYKNMFTSKCITATSATTTITTSSRQSAISQQQPSAFSVRQLAI